MTTEFRPSSRTPSGNSTDNASTTNGAMDYNRGTSFVASDSSQFGSANQTNAYGNDAQTITITRPSKMGVLQWFSNLSVGRKQLIGLFTSEVISVLGLVGIGSFLIVTGGRTQLLNQAKSELSVTEIGYNIKINQMGFGFRGQSDNQAIIEVATNDAEGRAISSESLDTVQAILQNEIQARTIEYATLVSNDLEIIASANADRQGETFDPSGLVGTVLQNPRQIKASAIVPWEELQREQPPLPEGFAEQDALIRYTVTPVKNPDTDQVVGVLVSGDIVNGKDGIPASTLTSFENGYSAVYQRQDDGQFALATSLDAGDSSDVGAAQANVPLTNSALIDQALANPDQTIALRDDVAGKTYTLAAKTINNFQGEPVAVLVRGTSETSLNLLITNSLKLQLVIALLALIADIFLARLLGRSILQPLQNLQQAAWKFGLGDRRARADIYATDEIGGVAQVFNQLAANINQSETQLQNQTQQAQLAAERTSLLSALNNRIRQSLDETSILNTAVEGLRDILGADRVLVYHFQSDYRSGDIVAESVGRNWKRAMGTTLEDPMTPEALERYRSGQVTYMENRDEADLTHCHCEILDQLDVKANMVAPMLAGAELMGLLCVHQCSGPRYWDRDEIELLQQVTTQVGYALAQARLLKSQELIADKERQLNEIVSGMRETLEEEKVYRIAVNQARRVLKTDRAVVYLFDETWKGTFVAESVGDGWPSAFGTDIYDPCFADKYVEQYRQGRIQATPDIQNSGLTECHLKQLEPFKVKANLVAPIVVDERLIGLLITHQCSQTRNWEQLEINFFAQVAIQLGFALEQARLFTQTRALSEQERQLNEIVSSMRETLEEDKIYRAAVNQTRQVLKADRTVVYLFDETWKGTFVAESVGDGWPSAFGTDIYDPCFADKYVEQYRQGRVQATPDVQNAGLTDCHLKQLEPFKVKANLVAPIVVDEKLIGLLITHQCSRTRKWEQLEVNFITQVALQLGFALEQARLFNQTQALSEERLERQQALQLQLVELLSDVEGASEGDLTVRADVTVGEIGTVADFFNAIVENLRQVVTKVKQSAEQVNRSIGENEGAIQTLADDALKQAEEVTRTLSSVEQMTQSIQQVAENARQAAIVANTASDTAESSGKAMDLTVQNILSLREIIGETSKKVKRLGESSQQISKVVSLINQISMQTNLLAINAGIEAARAGEEGQGFAVVAEEVGELAARSADATQEIERIVETIQRETVEVVEAMEQSTTEVVAGTHLVEDAKQNLGRILEISRQIDDLVKSVSEATVSQVEISGTVTQLMQDIAQVSERTSESSRQISGSLQQTIEVAQALQESVGTFKTGD